MVFGRGKGRRAQDDAATRGSASDATLERGAVDDLDGDVDSADLNTELGSSAAAGGQSAANPAEALLDVATERRRPFDSSEAPDDADSVMPRIDLG